MEGWWLLSPEELADNYEARLAKQQAYHNFLFGSTECQVVTNDIRELCFSSGKVELIEFYNLLRNNAGRTRITELAMIKAEAKAIEPEEQEQEEEEYEDQE